MSIDGNRIKSRRKEKDLNQKELAKLLDLNASTVNAYENGRIKKVNTTNLKKLAQALGTTSDFLIGLSDEPEPNAYGVKVPVYGSVPAGTPIEALHVDEGYVEIEPEMVRGDKRFLGLKVKGDSMYPYYMEGDVVIIEITPDFNSGDDIVVYVGDDYEATLKRGYKKDGYIELEPINREYSPKTFGPHDKPIRVLGIVREMRRFR